MIISELFEHFEKWLSKHRTESTRKHYHSRLKPFIKKFGSREFSSLSSLEVESYLSEVDSWPDGRLKAPDTRRANAVAFEQLQAFAIRHKEIKEPILSDIEKPAGKKRERLPTEEETEIILSSCSPEFGLIYKSLRQSGARPGELCQVQIELIDWKNSRIELKKHKTARKTGKPRIIMIGEKLEVFLREAIGDRTEGPVFLNTRREAWTTAKLSSTYARIREKAGLSKELCLYLARHEHATKLCEKVGIHAAKEALGHANINTTQRYVHVDEKEIRKNQDLF